MTQNDDAAMAASLKPFNLSIGVIPADTVYIRPSVTQVTANLNVPMHTLVGTGPVLSDTFSKPRYSDSAFEDSGLLMNSQRPSRSRFAYAGLHELEMPELRLVGTGWHIQYHVTVTTKCICIAGAYLNDGWVPVWVGLPTNDEVHGDAEMDRAADATTVVVKLGRGRDCKLVRVQPQLTPPSDYKKLLKETAADPGSDQGILGGPLTPQKLCCIATVQSISPLTLPGYGIVTWEGRKYCAYSVGYVVPELIDPNDTCHYQLVPWSRDVADWSIEWLLRECPDFVCMHDGFGYNIGRLAAHCSPKYNKLFMRVNLGKTSTGIDTAIPGCTVESISLASIAKTLGVEDKSKSPAMNVDPNDLAYDYTEVAKRSKCIKEIIALSVITKSPLTDCTRFISGTLMTNLTSTHRLSIRMIMDRSPKPPRTCKYQGATVLHPVKGLHHNVEVYDFNSLYPNIMISANTSVETVRAIDLENPAIASNSLYGAAGTSTSGMSSVHTAATVTAIGRWLIMLASCIAKVVGCYVLYGDTESVFLKAASQSRSATFRDQPLAPSNVSSTFVAIFHDILKHTPFTCIKFSHEKTYELLTLVKPKMYYGVHTVIDKQSRKVVRVSDAKGLAMKRRDCIAIARVSSKRACEIICREGVERCLTSLAQLIFNVSTYIDTHQFTLAEASLERKRDGIVYYVFVDDSGDARMVPVDFDDISNC
ncbi:hypothetical protein BDK51DRAFT_41767 [Blyttiomyces helicus]|uniref:DNA-directed DNA polymerase n=1 Tax=Blyttiomyces helicus TaxID=388810 RepID=A0A4P9WE74_9FUNG|nr:hypothetical protein BDK51DRAFT_41767 [Blyttiomyces helicus]|eukprot:RKO89993.1 hypothetical protein BDK51DRAFT_41767 [Blyttiomyces helicus]